MSVWERSGHPSPALAFEDWACPVPLPAAPPPFCHLGTRKATLSTLRLSI